MISIEAARAAALSDVPWDRLDELVRVELAAGRKVKEIAADFIGIADEVWDTPGLSVDGHDALGDTLDALTGCCHSDYCYKDPPNNTLPLKDEVIKLPKWARVAFAARCMRRVIPMYRHHMPTASDTDLDALWRSIEAGEQAAELALDTSSISAMADGLRVAGQALQNAADVFGDDQNSPKAQSVAMIALAAATTGMLADMSPFIANHAVGDAFDITLTIRKDFDHLGRLAEWQHWTDDTPVPPDVFGPLWPEGPPPGWPADPDVPQRVELPVSFLALEKVIPMALEDEAVNVFNALNRYYIARTGDRLTLDGDIHTLVTALVGAGV
jgi:hypothetical protein